MNESQWENYKRDLLYRSLDRIRIGNPTTSPFTLIWDGFKQFTIEPFEEMTVERWKAEQYAKVMSAKIIDERNQTKADKILADRSQKGQVELTAFEKQETIYNRLIKTNDENILEEIYKELILGMVERYNPERADDALEHVPDLKTTEEKMLELTDRPYVVKKMVLPEKEPVMVGKGAK